MTSADFTKLIKEKGRELFRDMPWRADTRPYHVLVSEIMLQQTQVSRVLPKFHEFITKFPHEKTLAQADLADVLKIWQGLGYNRRAKFLHETAKEIVRRNRFPNTQKELQKLPGIGENTAGAILTYSFNQPAIFVETNIRTVYLHHFFHNKTNISDKEIREKLSQKLDKDNPRKFYWALMDYGTYLKENGIKNTANSHHYKKQSPLAGSIREVRGQIIRELTTKNLTENDLRKNLNADKQFDPALHGLLKDNLIEMIDQKIRLKR
jgi:A/G-specific adenine glycosylase